MMLCIAQKKKRKKKKAPWKISPIESLLDGR